MSVDSYSQTGDTSTSGSLTFGLKSNYDFIVCGAGSAGCVVAARLSELLDVQVLLLEAGDDDISPTIYDPGSWPLNLGSKYDWNFVGEPNPHLNDRRLPLNMGKGLGGGSSINVMVWARGHKTDWDYYAEETGEASWGYESILSYYRRIENWQGEPDPLRRGNSGPVYVAPPVDPQPLAHATLEAASALGIPRFDSPNGKMMEGAGGVAFADLRIRTGRRQSVYRSYVYPRMYQPNLTVVTHAQVTRLLFEGKQVIGVEAVINGQLCRIGALCEVIMSMGAIQTPKVLMQSGIGPQQALSAHGINVVEDLPGVGQNHQDHVAFGCTWEYRTPQPVNAGGCESTLYWKSDTRLDAPDLLQCQLEFAVPSPPEVGTEPPEHGWSMFAGLARPKSRGSVRLSGPNPDDPLLIDPNVLSEPEDLDAAFASVELCRAIGNHPHFDKLIKREVTPLPRERRQMEQFIRNSAVTFWHQACTAKMGRDAMSVVDGQLRVYGIKNLRIADASVLPRIPVGNIMAPCVVVGERAADLIKTTHGLHTVGSHYF
ncbi:GMC family oxidoreductase N-terminal domain-containing protein [Kosakonia sp. BYX6]|uniref:GMC family oxidoreductase N-terminal domain-containing protein n=1 Tax=Kosakonia calanthes TaxID=3139408 RepID=A0ABZ3BAF6_9ENTR